MLLALPWLGLPLVVSRVSRQLAVDLVCRGYAGHLMRELATLQNVYLLTRLISLSVATVSRCVEQYIEAVLVQHARQHNVI